MSSSLFFGLGEGSTLRANPSTAPYRQTNREVTFRRGFLNFPL